VDINLSMKTEIGFILLLNEPWNRVKEKVSAH